MYKRKVRVWDLFCSEPGTAVGAGGLTSVYLRGLRQKHGLPSLVEFGAFRATPVCRYRLEGLIMI